MLTYSLITFLVLLFSYPAGKTSEKKNANPCTDCNLEGIFTGIATDSRGHSSPLAYEFKENNLTVGYILVEQPAVTFGGYKFTCDSLTISSFYTDNESYYLLSATVNEEQTEIRGRFQNQKDKTDYGTFRLSRTCKKPADLQY